MGVSNYVWAKTRKSRDWHKDQANADAKKAMKGR